jgi:hypothetical protein
MKRHQTRRRIVTGFFLMAGAAFALADAPSAAEDFDNTMRSVVGVRFEHAPNDVSEGMGVYVGDGRVYTAAHVLGRAVPAAPVTIVAVNGSGYYDVTLAGTIEKVHPEFDAAIVHVAEPRGLLPLRPCPPARPGDQVSLTRLSELDEGRNRADRLYVLEIEDRAFVTLRGLDHAVIPGAVDAGFSGGPALNLEAGCFYGIVSGGLTMTSRTKDRVRRLERVLLIAPSAFSGL